MVETQGIFIVTGDINDAKLLKKLFDVVPFTHVHSNIAGLVTLLEICKSANPQPAIVWASSSSVYGLNEDAPFSESDQTDQPASLYAATKKAGEEITHTYNHIYRLSITGLRFFTVYGPWGRPDMAYFSFTRNILQGKPITVYRGKNMVDLARDFTYIDDIVKGCLGSLDTSGKSTGSGGRRVVRRSIGYSIWGIHRSDGAESGGDTGEAFEFVEKKKVCLCVMYHRRGGYLWSGFDERKRFGLAE
ncbi:UDP-glucuronate 4-epimerase 1 [Linum grandiflorum]